MQLTMLLSQSYAATLIFAVTGLGEKLTDDVKASQVHVLSCSSLITSNMARRQSEHTRRARAQARQQNIAAGNKPRLRQDWECPICSRWFSRRRNGPQNHLRSHKLTGVTKHHFSHSPSSTQRASSSANQPESLRSDFNIDVTNDLLDTEDSSSDSDVSTSFDTTHKSRRAHHANIPTDPSVHDNDTCK